MRARLTAGRRYHSRAEAAADPSAQPPPHTFPACPSPLLPCLPPADRALSRRRRPPRQTRASRAPHRRSPPPTRMARPVLRRQSVSESGARPTAPALWRRCRPPGPVRLGLGMPRLSKSFAVSVAPVDRVGQVRPGKHGRPAEFRRAAGARVRSIARAGLPLAGGRSASESAAVTRIPAPRRLGLEIQAPCQSESGPTPAADKVTAYRVQSSGRRRMNLRPPRTGPGPCQAVPGRAGPDQVGRPGSARS